MKPLFIFDLDGTLSDTTHRLHYIQGPKKDWDNFFSSSRYDPPIPAGIAAIKALKAGKAEVWVWTGRIESTFIDTVRWLNAHAELDIPFWSPMRKEQSLRMRGLKDHRPDHELKKNWLTKLDPEHRLRLAAVFEDRQQVVDMWRAEGVPCFQVAPGNY